MNEMIADPRKNPMLKSLVGKAIWMARTFGYWRWSPVPLDIRTGIRPKNLHNNFIFEWENIRIQTFETVPIPKADDNDLLQDEDPNFIISLRRVNEMRLFGIVLFRYHCFQEMYVSDSSGERLRLQVPEGADLAELGSEIDELHNALQRLKAESGMTAEEIKALSKRTLKQMLKVHLSALPDLRNPHL